MAHARLDKATIAKTSMEGLSDNAANPKKKKLTVSQLTDLYRRLDVNGDGELDMAEFAQIVKKIGMQNISNAVVSDIFRRADTSGGGKLSVLEFVHAYHLLYAYNPAMDSIIKNMDSTVRAIRYGLDRTYNKFIFEIYSGNVNTIYYKTCYYEDGTTKKFHLDRSYKGKLPTSTKHGSSLKHSNDEKVVYDLEYINSLIIADAKFNKESGAKIFWWVDISSAEVVPGSFLKAFGLPEKIEPNFYYDVLEPSKDSRFNFSGFSSEIDSKIGFHHYSSMSLFVQSMWLKSLPVIPMISSSIEYFPGFIQNFAKYFFSRTFFFYNYSGAPDHEHTVSITRARDLEKELGGEKAGLVLRPKKPAPSEMEHPMLLSRSDLAQRIPKFIFNTVSVHLIDQGFGPITLVTYHQYEDEREVNLEAAKWSAEEQSNCGIIGRILSGVRHKLCNLMANGGVATTDGELADSSVALAAFIIDQVHNFSMGAIGSIDTWINSLKDDVEICAVTKHDAHNFQISQKLKAMKMYVEPIHSVLDDIVSGESELSETTDLFLGKGLPLFEQLYEGNKVTGKKGTKYWTQRLDQYEKINEQLFETYSNKLNEQRSTFWFFLSIFVVVTWPCSFMLAYWGMNFDNQMEKYSAYRPGWFGINFFWIANGFIYTIIFCLMLHFRIFYTAS